MFFETEIVLSRSILVTKNIIATQHPSCPAPHPAPAQVEGRLLPRPPPSADDTCSSQDLLLRPPVDEVRAAGCDPGEDLVYVPQD